MHKQVALFDGVFSGWVSVGELNGSSSRHQALNAVFSKYCFLL